MITVIVFNETRRDRCGRVTWTFPSHRFAVFADYYGGRGRVFRRLHLFSSWDAWPRRYPFFVFLSESRSLVAAKERLEAAGYRVVSGVLGLTSASFLARPF